ncbi:hypothetical protein [uncultured Microbulbifer sp.]|uniref:hypothetical protein n=1 Tax=uncultured Microbulbifer sp. TaxID=348147 RepID=UPI0026206C2D|nr:hypothetical protein [uncultured Microbulbifer sp.]
MKTLGFGVVLLAVGLGGCAMTYEAPDISNKPFSTVHLSSKQDILEQAEQALLLEGFQIQSSDLKSGYISTSLKNWRLTPEQASCGKTMGIDYLKDNRTKTEVAFNVVVNDQEVIIRSNIQGEYKPGAATQDITLTCVSRGVIEAEIAEKILF